MSWIVPKETPNIKQTRKWLAFKLVAMARKVHPGNKAATAFDLSLMRDFLISGQAITRLDPTDIFNDAEGRN